MNSSANKPDLLAIGTWKLSTIDEHLVLTFYLHGNEDRKILKDASEVTFPTPNEMVLKLIDVVEGKVQQWDESLYPAQKYVRVMNKQQEARTDFALTKAEMEGFCEDFMTGEPRSFAPILLPFSCQIALGKGEQIDMTILASGGLEFSRDKTVVYSLPNAEDTENFDEGVYLIDSFDGPLYMPDNMALRFQDVTFDGYKDLVVQTGAGAYNITYNYYAYNPETHTFEAAPLVTAVNPEFYPENKTIVSYNKYRGVGDMYEDETYEFQNGKYVLIHREVQEGIYDDEGNITSYKLTIEDLKNGKLTVTSREMLDPEEVDPDYYSNKDMY